MRTFLFTIPISNSPDSVFVYADFDLAADFCRFLPIRLRSGSDAAFHDDVRRQMRSRTRDDEYDDEYDDKNDE